MADVILFTPQRGWTLNGAPLVGGKAIFLQSGTDTEQTVYSDAALTAVITQPVLADSNGVFPAVYFSGASQVRAIIRDSADVELSDIDPVPTAPLSAGGASGVTFTPRVDLPFDDVQEAIEGAFDTIEGRKTGNDTGYVSGTAGDSDDVLKWNADGDAVEGPAIKTTVADSDDEMPTSGAVVDYVLGKGAPSFLLEDQKAAGTDGGASVAAWTTRDLNTEVRDANSIVSISSNEFTPTAACWVEWESPTFASGRAQSRLYNVTDATVVKSGTTMAADAVEIVFAVSRGAALVEANKTYRIEQNVQTARATDGFGQAADLGETEVYTRVVGWEV